MKSIIKFKNLNQKIINTSHDKAVTMFKYYFNAAEISFSKFLIQIKNFQFKNHIANQIIIRLILLLANMNNKDDKKSQS